ncbi:OmpH family outer membrane protein [Salibacteraceae bacterium]|jgi:outer membrane protein|nr:OmpH family outer membrane protein [Salibacteraceae bacterium]
MNIKYIVSIAVIALTLSSCDKGSNETNTTEGTTVEATPSNASIVNGDLKVAYINSDSLFARYDLYKDLEEEFIEEKVMAENSFKSKVAALEKDYQDAQAGAAQLSEEALQILGAKLQQREQQLMGEKQQMESILMQSEQNKNDKLYEKLRAFLDDYASAKGYHMIYGYNGFGDVLYMDSQFDITDQVIDSLNSSYSASKIAEVTAE